MGITAITDGASLLFFKIQLYNLQGLSAPALECTGHNNGLGASAQFEMVCQLHSILQKVYLGNNEN